MTCAVITIVHGRHDHLERQTARLECAPGVDLRVVVAVDDPEAAAHVAGAVLPTRIASIPATPLGLPLAAARNLGARVALDDGADVLVFLDVDCMPVPDLVAAYAASASAPATRDALLCGPVAYLPPDVDADLPVDRLADLVPPHPARPAPAPGEVVPGVDHALFWSLSFALTATTWNRIGGFCEDYAGYGGEDTDFAAAARELGIGLAFVGAARAFHQYHPTSSPPVQHLTDIVRNANLYRSRWGAFPMTGWLDRFEQDGFIELDAAGDRYVEVPARSSFRSPR